MKKRYEAFEVTDVDDMFSVLMNIMPRRYDATNYTMVEIPCENMDQYIAKMRAQGKKYSYMYILIAAIVRTYAIRRGLNRFIINARLYERYKITVCFMIKQFLKDDSPELLIKQDFNGNETIEQIVEILNKKIGDSMADIESNSTQAGAGSVAKLPMFLSKAVVNFLRFTDKHNCMPKKFFDVSPFHTSFFLTNLKSIKTENVLHHLYDFGTTSIFFSMGKDRYIPIVNDNGEIVPGKRLQLGVSTDERICDGLYHGKSFHMLGYYMQHPEELEVEYHDDKVDAEIEKDRIAAEKQAKKDAKKQAKAKKK